MARSAAILIVEDDPNILISLKFIFGNAGHVVTTATDGAAAWQLLEQSLPDLAVLDIMLPTMDGFELVRRMRADAKFQATKILMLSARGRENEIGKGLALGADAYLTKPFATRELLQKAAELLSG